MSIWDIGIQILSNKNKNNLSNENDTTLFFVGDKNSGKTSMIYKFLDKNEIPKPTVALDYLFGHQTKGHNIPKIVTHILELGGSIKLQKLIDVVITPENIRTLTLIVVVNLSEPSNIFTTIETLLNVAKARIKYILEKINDGDATRSFLLDKMKERIGKSIEDDSLNPFLIPLVIIGGKYDKFQEIDLKRRTVICKTLRFLSHHHGGSLIFFSSNQESLVNRMRALIKHCAFGSTISKTVEVSPKNPLSIAFGCDSSKDIGNPEFSDGTAIQLPSENMIQFWKRAYFSFYAPKDIQATEILDPGNNSQFMESLVDEAKRRKDEELEKYRKISDRKMRDMKQQAINDGIIVI